jgi:hypothetical protein
MRKRKETLNWLVSHFSGLAAEYLVHAEPHGNDLVLVLLDIRRDRMLLCMHTKELPKK